MRFRKRLQICKGVKLNLSTSGVSATIGGKGLSFNLGKKGLFMNTSIPGTGLYDRKKLIGPDKKKKTAAREQEVALPAFSLAMDEGDVSVVNSETGREITSPATLRKIRATEQYEREHDRLMEQYRDEIEDDTLAFVEIARHTPALCTDWEDDRLHSPAQIEEGLEAWLQELELPLEFGLDFEYHAEEQLMLLDLDLPEIEDIPEMKAVELADGTVRARQKSLKDLRADYVRCVFGLAVFFAGNTFNLSPHIEQVWVSGYTQRRNRVGDLQDTYIYSVKFTREGMEGVDFAKIDPVELCMAFGNRCNIATTGEMKEIEPYQI